MPSTPGPLRAGCRPARMSARGRRRPDARSPPRRARPAASPSLAAAVAGIGWAATTVSATMVAAHAAGIRVFATGGIGGVHRAALASAAGRLPTFDISADLEELARTPMIVVCAGPKAILDVPATLEYP